MRIVLRASVITLPAEKFSLHEEFPKDWKLHYSYLQHISTGTDITFLLPMFVLLQIYYYYYYYYYFLLFQAVSSWYFSSCTNSGPLAEASNYVLQYLITLLCVVFQV